ncbi:MAG: hypothetical protein VKJ24_20660 [Synechococcales bacterium]|nr:hypothetical protein [Synechococcales bacterium]
MLDFGFWILDCMDERVFQGRTKAIALRTIRLVNTLPSSGAAGVIGKQLLRSAFHCFIRA